MGWVEVGWDEMVFSCGGDGACGGDGGCSMMIVVEAVVSSVGRELIRPGSFSGYQQKAPSILEHWNFHILQRE
jgi:hypothetical protein